MRSWLNALRYDPIEPLLSSGVEALVWHVRRDLLGESVAPVKTLWNLPAVQKLLRRQQADGSFKYPGRRADVWPDHHYPLFETWKQLRFLVDQFGLTKRHPAAAQAAEFILSCQTRAGDIRGLLANQYATYYTGALLGLLIRAGYGRDPRIERGLRWLLSMRQDDSGWTIPILTAQLSRTDGDRVTREYTAPIEPDRSQPFSHNWTGMILRAFAAHPRHRRSKAARQAAHLLKSRFFQPDHYRSYQSSAYWVIFQYPFWWNHLVAVLDTLSLIGVPADDADIRHGLDWLVQHQQRNGMWKSRYDKRTASADPRKADEMSLWVTLAICRVLKRYFGAAHT